MYSGTVNYIIAALYLIVNIFFTPYPLNELSSLKVNHSFPFSGHHTPRHRRKSVEAF